MRKEHQKWGCEKCSELAKTAQVWEKTNSRAAEALCAACLAAPLSVLGTALSEYPGCWVVGMYLAAI